MYKSAQALGILHEYDAECMVLRALLAQRRWRRSKRGCVAFTDLVGDSGRAELTEQSLVRALSASAHESLQLDSRRKGSSTTSRNASVYRRVVGRRYTSKWVPLLLSSTNIVYRPALSRRLTRLENKLDLPSDERHISHASLHTCETRELVAPRAPDNMGAPKLRARYSGDARDREASMMGDDDEGLIGPAGLQQTGKSVWLGREGEVTVEGWVLEWWEQKGYKG